MNELFPIEQIDILHFDRNKGKRVVLKECDLITNFLFNKFDFYLLYKRGYFFICLSHNKDLILVWYKKEKEEGEKFTSGDIMSIFRKKYLSNNITKEKIELFLDNPIEYEKNYPKNIK